MNELSESLEHLYACHDRWIGRVNRDKSVEDPPDEWVWNQCESCRYWIPLTGKFRTDWGGCSNRESAFDGVLRFAHDGCDKFEEKATDSE
ncbi:DUF3027 domain-containing protein [Montanilutibacter psychrotolerans]|uniref:DUF3027 domain-containing protein n=1 Tax=Montanilutibacter psychrotolerans TaxID=1327343 RepID=A0A3M8T414_9GAMM|nr:DUF3027 domain-containing protein [Lysobacter psychrotolerans]